MGGNQTDQDTVQPQVPTPPVEPTAQQPVQPSQQSTPDPNIVTPPPKKKMKKKLVVTIVIVVLILGGIAAYLLLWGEGSSSNTSIGTEQTEQAVADQNDSEGEPVKRIFFAEGGPEDTISLYSIQPTTKEVNKVDTRLASGGGVSNIGSDTPLNAPDFFKVVYVKEQAVWIAGDNIQPRKIEQPEIDTSNMAFHRPFLSAWSSDSNYVVFAIYFSCPVDSSIECSPDDENEELTGIYSYSLATSKTTKLPIDGVSQWLPGSPKVVYFDTNNNDASSIMRTYDVVTGQDEQLSVAPFNFGVQASFSDDGSKLIYSQGVNGAEGAEIIIANTNNTNQQVLRKGEWAELQWPMFLNNSNQNYAYIHRIDETCPGGGGCLRSQLNLVLNGVENVIGDTRRTPIGNFGDYVVVLTGSSVFAYGEPYVVSINLENTNTERAESSIYSKAFDASSSQDIMLRIGH